MAPEFSGSKENLALNPFEYPGLETVKLNVVGLFRIKSSSLFVTFTSMFVFDTL
ncbi:hypothetical protein [uncultured Butyricimonas sp.]|uniref:hypothetical protein n=1 Tax=uncultured Butyricimonas sp. TaxID=1268785 RepID=UPI0026DB8B88|nr:hypothetical protein [uncultured Butyricimonas sp.]